MLNKFCFHLYAEYSLFIAENHNVFFYHHYIITLTCYFRCHRAGSQLTKVVPRINISIRHVTCNMWHAACDMWHNYKYSLLSLHMKTKVVQHVEREWMREWESVRVCEFESVRVREWNDNVFWTFVFHFMIFLPHHHPRSCDRFPS